MKQSAARFFLVGIVTSFVFVSTGNSHPGRTAADGCHYCRSNCASWGVPYGKRHCHGGSKNYRSVPKTKELTSLPNDSKRLRTVVTVIDGDTIVLDGGEKIRLIGVDTPETVHPNKPVEYFGKEASAFTRRLCEGKKVRLEYDLDRVDKYGRTLAYVYLEDGTFVNAEIIKQGYGHAYTRFPFKYMGEFRKYEREARKNRRGLWK